jgi:hypothetical protein
MDKRHNSEIEEPDINRKGNVVKNKLIPFPGKYPCNPFKLRDLFRSIFAGED